MCSLVGGEPGIRPGPAAFEIWHSWQKPGQDLHLLLGAPDLDGGDIKDASSCPETAGTNEDGSKPPTPGNLHDGDSQRLRNSVRRKMATLKRDSQTDHVDPVSIHRKEREKSDETKKLISTAMEQDRICAILDASDIQKIVDEMEYFEFATDEIVTKQGATEHYLFVTEKGNLEVSLNEAPVATLGPGSVVGGQGVLYNCPRGATVSAKGPGPTCGLWGVEGKVFRQVLQTNAQRRYTENRAFVDSIKMFEGLDSKQKDRISEAFFTEVFQPGARVVTQNEPSPVMYFLKKGELRIVCGAEVCSNGELRGGQQLGAINPGEGFGERALLYNEPRSATAISSSSTSPPPRNCTGAARRSPS